MFSRIAGFARKNVVGLIALFVALGGTAYANNEWTGANIVDGSLTSADYKNNNIKGIDLAANAIPSDENCGSFFICFGSTKLADRSVGASEISPGAVGTSEVAPNSLTGSDVNEGALDSSVVQRRVGGDCQAGDSVRAVNGDGSVACSSGPAAFSTFVNDTGQICDVGCTEATLHDIPAGTYLIIAKIRIDQFDHDVSFTTAQCELVAGSDPSTDDVDFADFAVGDADNPVATLPMQVVHTFASTDNASINCHDAGSGDVSGRFARITAVRLGALNDR
jgi:hypothetical protein